jgi:hypothetical protein
MLFSMLWLACTAVDDSLYSGPTGEGNDIFCSSYDDADTIQETDVSSLVGSGRLRVQLIVDRSNPKDGDIIGNAEYRLSNDEISGAEQQGTMSPLGEFTKTLGPGTWMMTVNGAEDCSNAVEISIQESLETYVCVPLYCE